MNTTLKQLACFAAFTCGASFAFSGIPGFSRTACAQNPFEDPFGASPAAPIETTEPAPEEKEAKPDDGETDTIVLAIRATNPSTPEQLLEAIRNLINYGRADEAKKYAQVLLGLGLDAPTLTDLHNKFRSGLFVRLMRKPDFQPEGAQLAKAILDASYQAARAPAHLATLIRNLSSPKAEVRYTAMVDLRDAGEAAVAALISALADESRSEEHPALRDALVRLGKISEAPLLGSLEAPDPTLRANAIRTLGQMRSANALPFLLVPAMSDQEMADEEEPEVRRSAEWALQRLGIPLPDRQDARIYLQTQLVEYLHGRDVGDSDAEGRVLVWRWDPKLRTTIAEQVDHHAASLWIAGRIANELHALLHEEATSDPIVYTALLELEKTTAGLDLPLPLADGSGLSTLHSLPAEQLETILAFALDKGYRAAAIGALELLAEQGDTGLLASTDGHPREVVKALQHIDRRVRFAAATAIMQWDPDQPYAGSSYLPEALVYFARSAGNRRVLIGHPRTEQAQTLVGILNRLGFEADAVATGRAAVKNAINNPDYEFVLLSDSLDHPCVEEVIQQLRHHYTSATLPVGLMARERNIDRLQRVSESDPLTRTFPRPHDVVGVALQTRRLLMLPGGTAVEGDWRTTQATDALKYLSQLAGDRDRYRFYDLLNYQEVFAQALNHPRLTAHASKVLGYLGSAEAQRTLVTLASQNGRPLRERESAAGAFHEAVGRRGLLLSRNEILLQYDRYNRSKQLDTETQRVLGSILDTIEKKE